LQSSRRGKDFCISLWHVNNRRNDRRLTGTKEFSMDFRLPQPKSAASLLKTALAAMNHDVGHTQCLELIAKVYGYDDWYTMERDQCFERPLSLKAKSSTHYEFANGADEANIDAGTLQVRARMEGDGVLVAVYPATAVVPERDLGFVRVRFAEAIVDRVNPDPKLPFYGCCLPFDMIAIEFVSSDARAQDWKNRYYGSPNNSVIDWINTGMESHDADLSEAILYVDDQYFNDNDRALTAEDIYEAALEPDGRFVLKGGRELYLIDRDNQRWYPKDRI
jgi:hypothetical protein